MAKEKTYEEWLDAIENEELDIDDLMDVIPKDMITPELCFLAISKGNLRSEESSLLTCIPKEMLDDRIIKEAINRYPSSIEGIENEEALTEDLVLYAIKKAGKYQQNIGIPDRFMNLNTFSEAVDCFLFEDKMDIENLLRYVPENMWNDIRVLQWIVALDGLGVKGFDMLDFAPVKVKYNVDFWCNLLLVHYCNEYSYHNFNERNPDCTVVAFVDENDEYLSGVPEELREEVKKALRNM